MKNKDCSFCGYRDLPEAVDAHKIGINEKCPLRNRFSGWISVNDRIPDAKGGAVLVTNNLIAMNARGKKSHVWISTTGIYEDSTQPGTWCIFTDCEKRISFVSHWRQALPEESGYADDRSARLIEFVRLMHANIKNDIFIDPIKRAGYIGMIEVAIAEFEGKPESEVKPMGGD